VSDRARILFICFVEGIDMPARNYQDVGRGLRADVIKRNASIVLEDKVSRNLSFNNFAEYTVFSHVETYLDEAVGCCGDAVGHPVDIAADPLQLFHDILITTVDMVNAVNERFPVST
jgi:hypothetical protein